MENKKNEFEFAKIKISDDQKSLYEYTSIYKDAWNKFRKNKTAIVGVVIFFFLILFTIIFTLLPNFDALTYSDDLDSGFSSEHWFGTDSGGRDFWSRCWGGIKYSLLLALITTILNLLIAILIGLFMGYFERFDKIFGNVIKIMYALPTIIVLILFAVIFRFDSSDYEENISTYYFLSFLVVILSLVFSGWVDASQQIRGQVLKIKNLDFITASQTLGTKRFQILKIFLVYSLPIIIVQFVIIFPRMIISESILGFLGLSVPEIPTLGNLINDGRAPFLNYPRELLIPLAFLAVTTVSIQLIGFGVEDSLIQKEGR